MIPSANLYASKLAWRTLRHCTHPGWLLLDRSRAARRPWPRDAQVPNELPTAIPICLESHLLAPTVLNARAAAPLGHWPAQSRAPATLVGKQPSHLHAVPIDDIREPRAGRLSRASQGEGRCLG